MGERARFVEKIHDTEPGGRGLEVVPMPDAEVERGKHEALAKKKAGAILPRPWRCIPQ